MRRVIFIAAMAVAGVTALAQEKEDRTLLSQEQMTAIINEVSGERAHASRARTGAVSVRPPAVRVSGPLPRERGDGEVRQGIRLQQRRDRRLSRPARPSSRSSASSGSPRRKTVKIYDIHDIPESLASTNANGDISGELVNVGQGTAQDFEGKDVKGKFVLSLGAERPRRRLQPRRRGRRDRRARHQRHRRRRSRGRLSGRRSCGRP